MAEYVGVDWGSNGWVCTRRNTDSSWEATLQPSFLDVWAEYKDADLILVDIPIGLPAEGKRACDEEAKNELDHAPQRVFWTPPRKALTKPSYGKAKEVVKENTNGSMTVQSWSILPRIQEVDTFLSEYPDAHGTVREAHPEIAFAKLAGEHEGLESKLKEVVKSGRLGILGEHESGIEAEYNEIIETQIDSKEPHERRFSSSNKDDILDAMGLAMMASIANGELKTLPEDPSDDPVREIPMEIVYSTGTSS